MKTKTENITILSNQFTLQQGDWLTVPYGDHPHSQGMQRLTPDIARSMTDRFHSWRGKLARAFGGMPFYVGHPDDPAFANEYPDKRAYGWIMDMEARPDGLAIQVKWNSLGEQTIANAEYKWFSIRWTVKQIGILSNGKPIFEPLHVISAGLTNRPNIGHMPLSNEDMSDLSPIAPGASGDPSETQTKGDAVKDETRKALIQLYKLSNEATEEQILAAATAQATLLTNEQTAHATAEKLANDAHTALVNEQTARATAETTLANERTARQAKEADLSAQLAAQKKARIDLVLSNAIAAGKITEAQRPQWLADLEKDLDGNIVVLSNAKPIVKTTGKTGDLGGRNSATISRQDQILTLVNEKVDKGMDYDAAWLKVKKENAALFEEPKTGKEG